MPVFDILRKNLSYAFFAVGIVWIVILVLTSTPLNAWPVFACFVSGVLLRFRPGERLTWAWTASTGVFGLILSSYQTYAWVPFLTGAFALTAATSLAGFAVFAVAHALLIYTGRAAPSKRA